MADQLSPEAAILESLEAGWAAADHEARTSAELDAIRARCATLAGFVKEAWPVLEPDRPIIWNWHLDALCAHLEAITEGRLTRLLVNIPPGTSKSLIVSVLWPSFEWAQGLRSMRYLTTSFSESNAKRDTRKMRDLVLSEWFRALWPEVKLVRNGELSFANADTGGREACAFGSLTGQRADRLIIDDPHSTETAESDTERAATVRLFREGATNRLNDQGSSAIVVVMQRLHQADLSGAILELGGFEHLMLPMRYEPDRRCHTSIGFEDPRHMDGELLDPARFPAPVVDALERDMGSYAFAGQYQQRPAPRSGGMFRREWFGIVTELPIGCRRRARAWDLGATQGGGDPTAGVLGTWHDEARALYILHATAQRLGGAGVEALIKTTAATDGLDTVIRLPQDPGAAGKTYAAILIDALTGYAVKAIPPTGSKETRALALAAAAEAGRVFIVASGDPARDRWINELIEQLCAFPTGRHDDLVDAASDVFAELALLTMKGAGAFELMRQEAEALALSSAARPETVTLQVPAGISHVQGKSGRSYSVRNGLVEVISEDGWSLQKVGYRPV
jgi:predicted phage terminase large subunit-like protein